VWGSSPELADLVFSCLPSVHLPGLAAALPGLCFNIARYNVGGSSNASAGGQRIVYSPGIPWWKQMQGFWLDWASDDPASASWDWSVDANQRAMLLAARDRGADLFELFSNSPMWWMLYNHNPSGAQDGSRDNLQSWNVANHSRYLATVAAHASTHWGLNFTSIELFNEPAAPWWSSTGSQEGCHFDVSTQAAALEALPGELARAGLSGGAHRLRVAASDESRIDMALATWGGLPVPALAVIDQVNVHGYQEGGDRAGLYRAVVVEGGKVLRDSEYGDGDGSGGTLLTSLLRDWGELHPRGWCYWQVVDVSAGWGFLLGDPLTGTLLSPATKHYVVAQFSRHIKPGMETLDTGGDPRGATAAALDPQSGLLVVVLGNQEPAQVDVLLDLSAFPFAVPTPPGGLPVRAWWTSTASSTPDPAAAHSVLEGLSVSQNKTVAVSLQPWSVLTLEVTGAGRGH